MYDYDEGDDADCINCGAKLPEIIEEKGSLSVGPWWDGYCSTHCQQGKPVIDIDAILRDLDPYGSLEYTIGYDNNDGDWTACFDYEIVRHHTKGVLVLYKIVVDSDSGGFIETADQGESAFIFAKNIIEDWTGIGQELDGPWSEEDIQQAVETSNRWKRDMIIDYETDFADGWHI